MAKKKRRARPAARRRKRSASRPAVFSANPRKRHRRTFRRNPGGFSTRGIIAQVTDNVKGGVSVVGGELATKLVSTKLMGLTPGAMTTTVAELGISTAIGALAGRVLGRQVARDMAVGGYAGVLRSLVVGMNLSFLQAGGVSVLSGASGPRFILRNGKMTRLNGYAASTRLNGYVGTGGGAGQEAEMYGG